MISIYFQFPAVVPSVNQQFTRFNRFVVGYYSGSCFVRRGEYDTFERAITKQYELLELGYDARIVEVSLNLYLIG